MQYLDEDPRTNRIDDSLQLFTAICQNKLLAKAALVLMLNKVTFAPRAQNSLLMLFLAFAAPGGLVEEEAPGRHQSPEIVSSMPAPHDISSPRSQQLQHLVVRRPPKHIRRSLGILPCALHTNAQTQGRVEPSAVHGASSTVLFGWLKH